MHPAALLSAEETHAADAQTIRSGIPGLTLMENAARGVVSVIGEHYAPLPCLVVCGTGNNGGDGFAVARILKERGWPVQVVLRGDHDNIRGDAAIMRDKWAAGNPIHAFHNRLLEGAGLIVDAMFGTGLSRALDDDTQKIVQSINARHADVVAVDIPSGVHADNGAIMGAAVRATHTVTFFTPKLGHVLLPGKAHTGTLHVMDIGVRSDDTPRHFLNIPALWRSHFPFPDFSSHKYTRGHTIVLGGRPDTTGATRLAAVAALRAGSGLVSVACSQETLPIYAASLTAVMTKPVKSSAALNHLLEDDRVTAALIGPGAGIGESTRERTLMVLESKKPCVIDADALSAFKNTRKSLFASVKGSVVLTPHEGEFERLFAIKGARIERSKQAAKISGAVVVLKGNDTIIASPDGRAAVNAEAPPWLATAGSGDVLAGIITGLLAQSMPAFEAACAGVWMHSHAAIHAGPGLIADDLLVNMPGAWKKLMQ